MEFEKNHFFGHPNVHTCESFHAKRYDFGEKFNAMIPIFMQIGRFGPLQVIFHPR